jgi:hemerythrin-like domain-containing protein
MIEHSLIKKMVSLLVRERDRLKAGGKLDRDFNRAAVDFFRMYADRTHHGKEEQILFRELKKKDLSREHRGIIAKLESEHIKARERVAALLAAGTEAEAIACLADLAGLYPPHIAQEDKEFFLPVMDYFSDREKDDMLKEGQEFDRTVIHEKYQAVVGELEQRLSAGQEKDNN